jgi:N-acetylneuraminate synthase
LRIGNHAIGQGATPFIIAEMSGNHNRSIDRALELVDAVADTGAHALKLQTYTADTITLDVHEREFRIDDGASLWNGQSLYDLYEIAHTPWEWHAPIMQRAHERGLLCFSSPFDETAVDFLESLDVPAFKIASAEILHLPLIRKVAACGKPMIISTGMATLAEIDEAVTAARDAGCHDLVLLKCTSTYPASPSDTNVLTIPHMRHLFGCEVGLSDHTMGIGAAIAAIAHGASVIEKHFTLRREDGGVDSAFSLEPNEMRALVVESELARQALGAVTYGPTAAELKSLPYRRSLYISMDMQAGEVFTPENLRCVRPGLGLAPKYYETLLGHRIRSSVRKGTPMRWDLLE